MCYLLCIIVSFGVDLCESMCFVVYYCVLLAVVVWPGPIVVWPGPIVVSPGSRSNWLKTLYYCFVLGVRMMSFTM